MNLCKWSALLAMGAQVLLSGCDSGSQSKPGETATDGLRDYMVTFSRPNILNLVDLEDDKVVRQCEVPGRAAPGTVVVSPDRSIAYVLSDGFSNAYGFALKDCEMVFSTNQADGNIRVKTMASLAISPDGKELYTHQNRVKLLNDRYEIQPPLLAVFDTSAGLDVPPSRTFPAPRQVTIMTASATGHVYLGGPDIYKMDATTGEYEVALQSRSLQDPAYSPRDILSVWPLGEVNNEWIRQYSVVHFLGESGDMENAEFLWGHERVDLLTGATGSREFGPLDRVLFTGMPRPGNMDTVYGVLNQLQVFDANTQSVLRTIDLEHAYYCINFSTDGSKIYLSGTLDDIAVYDADSLEKITNIQVSGDMGMSNSYIFKRTVI
ncbi:MAG: quinohemoprotein amine dehydrogenase subunit beta [Halieaceae bacterium]|nr:quinohemoprotein amine dehydrogenase subunit beta [Halieaceae bacterium]